MAEAKQTVPCFNLWQEPWIAVECEDGAMERVGIEQALVAASGFRSIHDPSPLVVVGIHRLLLAVLQAALKPQANADLCGLWRAGRFPPKAIKDFGKDYADRFDLFSREAPFLQSADLALAPNKGDKAKSVAYLLAEVPAGTAITHYHHGAEQDQILCPACAAHGLVTIPPFATSGGAGIKPSINGVPPLYVIPGGRSLFESLAASLLLPKFQPRIASRRADRVWWTRPAKVERGKEVRDVGYLHSLTFPARRVRLHPDRVDADCTHCGRHTEWGVRTMIFEMGESRPKGAEPWLDPFAAYRVPKDKGPIPVRPTPGRALWREFASLFLPASESAKDKKGRPIRPGVLDQIADLELAADRPVYPFRCIGMRTDMKAKVFEWVDSGFEVPPRMLGDDEVWLVVSAATDLATDAAGIMHTAFREAFRGASKKAERHKPLQARMGDEYWSALAAPFRQLVLAVAQPEERERGRRQWADVVVQTANRVFAGAADSAGSDAASLRAGETGKKWCAIRLAIKRKEYVGEQS